MKIGDEITKDVVVNSFSKLMTEVEWQEFVEEVNSKLSITTSRSFVEFLVEDNYGVPDVSCELELHTTATEEDVKNYEQKLECDQRLDRIKIRAEIKHILDTNPEFADLYDEPVIPRQYIKYAALLYEYEEKYPDIVDQAVRLWKVARKKR